MHCAKCFFYEGDVGDEVCTRCGRAFLPEANVYLGLALLVTGGIAWALKSLLAGTADLFVRPGIDLGAWATHPVSVVDHPAYGLVIGGWLAMLAVAPVMTATMYGKRSGWLLCLAIAAVGPSVPLAAAAALGVWISGGRTLRLSSKLASGLLGLAPSALYWFAATWRSDVPNLSRTLDSMRYVAPLAAAVLAAAAVALTVLVGSADRWHIRWPGAMLSVLTVGPLLALLAVVGVDEVNYAMLPDRQRVPTSQLVDIYHKFLDRHRSGPVAARVRGELASLLEKVRAREADALPEAPSARYVWNELLEKAPESPWAVDARLHLADLSAAAGLFDEARRYTADVLARTAGVQVPDEDPLADFGLLRGMFTVGRKLRAKETALRLQRDRQGALMRAGLLRENRPASGTGDRALAIYFQALAKQGTSEYREALLKARDADPEGPLLDNIALELSKLEPDPYKRVANLKAVAQEWPDSDGAMLSLLAAADCLIGQAQTDPAALAAARELLGHVHDDLARRRAADPQDPYASALGDLVGMKISYVQAQIKTPESGK